jgi:hypothetical protein
MFKHFALTLAVMTAGAAIASSAAAMESGRVDCPDREVIVRDLEKAGEQRVAVGVKPEGIVMEIYVARNGDWTEIWTWPRGQSCVIAFGNSMAVMPPSEGT